tara:strand:+ start:308 stop:637 length:330 start_codon:yes stop_codon:yes gene_type:complete
MEDTITTNTKNEDPKADLKTRFANLLINRVALSECLNVIRDACLQRADDLIEQADETQMANILKDLETFENPPPAEDSADGVQAPKGDASTSNAPEVSPVVVPADGPEG